MFEEQLHSFLIELQDRMRTWRREFHQNPELGWMEYKTTYYIGTHLQSLGFITFTGPDALASDTRMGVPKAEVLDAYEQKLLQQGVPEEWIKKMKGGHTGLVAQWDTGRQGPHVAFRFDIDALPILESDHVLHFPTKEGFSSDHYGVMHSCGHDGHTAIGLGVAEFIARFQHVLHGRFTLLFQPAEEGARGAKAMVEKGWLDDVDYFLSGHIGIKPLQIGELVATTTNFLATSKFNVKYRGKSAHAGLEPEKGRNALLASAAATLHLQGISQHSHGATRINVGLLEAGSGRNVIADKARMELETRGETTELNQYMVNEAIRVIQAIALLYEVEVEIETVGEGIEVKTDESWIAMIISACSTSKQIKKIIPSMKLGASEDVTYMMSRVQERGGKANYLIFGTPLSQGHHHPEFDFNEQVLGVALEVYCRIIHHVLHDIPGHDIP